MKAQYDSMTQYNLAIVECWSPRIVIITEISAFCEFSSENLLTVTCVAFFKHKKTELIFSH